MHRQMHEMNMMRPRCNVVYCVQFINPRVIYTRRSLKQAVQSSCKQLLSRYVTFSSKFWTLFRENNYWLTRWDICLSTPSMAVVVNQRMKTVIKSVRMTSIQILLTNSEVDNEEAFRKPTVWNLTTRPH